MNMLQGYHASYEVYGCVRVHGKPTNPQLYTGNHTQVNDTNRKVKKLRP